MRSLPLRQAVGIYVAVSIATVILMQLRAVKYVGEQIHVLIGLLFLFAALRLARQDERGERHYGIALEGLLARTDDQTDAPLEPLGAVLRRALPSALRESAFALGLAAMIFPPFAIGFAWWHGPHHPFRFSLAPDFVSFALTQLVVVALPEEAFFRGYLQTKLTDAFPRTHRFLFADVSIAALVIQAALFALIHAVVDLDPIRLAVFFPGLLFGWMRAKRGGIGAGMFMHALCNIYSDILMRGWLV